MIETESDFREYLKCKGFSVNEKSESENGIDIVALKDGHYFLIEVKKVTPDKNGVRARVDQMNALCDFGIIISSTGIIYPKEIEGKPYSKIVRFMEMFSAS